MKKLLSICFMLVLSIMTLMGFLNQKRKKKIV